MVSNLNPRQFTVLDFQAAKRVKERTGQAKAIQAGVESSDFARHADEAMRMGNAVKKKPRKSDRFWRALGMDGVE